MQVETASGQVRAYARSGDGEADRKVEQNRQASADGGGESPAVLMKESQEPRSQPMFTKSDTAAQTGKNLDISV